MVDFGIYEIQRDDNGIFILTEQLLGHRESFATIQELVEYIQNDLENVATEIAKDKWLDQVKR